MNWIGWAVIGMMIFVLLFLIYALITISEDEKEKKNDTNKQDI